MAGFNDEDEDLELTEGESNFDFADPSLLPVIPTQPAKAPALPPSSSRLSQNIPKVSAPKPIEQLTDDERRDFVRGIINEKYNKPVDYDKPVNDAKESADKSTFWSHIGETVSGLGGAKAAARGVGTDRSASWNAMRKGFGDRVDEAKGEREKSKVADAAGRLKDAQSPESQRAREQYAQLYKSAYGGKLPDGYAGLTAEALTGGIKSVQAMLKDLRDREGMGLRADITNANNETKLVGSSINQAGMNDRAAKGRDLSKELSENNRKQREDHFTTNKAIKNAELGIPGYELDDSSKVRPTATDTSKLRRKVAMASDVNQTLDDVASMYKEDGGKLVLPTQNRAKVKGLLAKLVLKIGTIDAQSALQAGELQLVQRYIPTIDSPDMAKDFVTKIIDEDPEGGSRFLSQLGILRTTLNRTTDEETKAFGYKKAAPEGEQTEEAASESKPPSKQPESATKPTMSKSAVAKYVQDNLEYFKRKGVTDPAKIREILSKKFNIEE